LGWFLGANAIYKIINQNNLTNINNSLTFFNYY
jgi:hypothetical protein